MILKLVSLFALSGAVSAATGGNMNGHYQTASVDNVSTIDHAQSAASCWIRHWLIISPRWCHHLQIKTSFNDDYASKGHEFFDIYAPEIATHYGEVFWTSQGVQPLPEEIIKRFDGKVMAITGYEQDQVMVTPVGKPGANPEKDVSVPINWA